jgi:hypothetical protein
MSGAPERRGHPLEHAGGAVVAVVHRVADEPAVGVEQAVVHPPRVDAERVHPARCPQAVPDSLVERLNVPAQRAVGPDRDVGEPVQLGERDLLRRNPAEHDPAAGGAQIDGRDGGHQRRNAAATPASTGMCRPVVRGQLVGGQHEHRGRHVLGQHLQSQQRSLGVERAQFGLRHAVHRRALGAPTPREDAGAAHHPVRVDAVDPDAVPAELGGEQPDLMGLVPPW